MMDEKDALKRFGDRVGYSPAEIEQFREGDPRVRLITRPSQTAALYFLEAEVVKAKNCNSGYRVGDRFILDVAGNLIRKLSLKRLCIYAISQLVLPVALINERLSEGLDPNQFHFMHFVRCPDVGVECSGYGEVMLKIMVVPRRKTQQV